MVFHCTIGPRCSVTSYSNRYVVKSKTMPIFWCCAGLIGLKIGHYQVSGTSGYIRITPLAKKLLSGGNWYSKKKLRFVNNNNNTIKHGCCSFFATSTCAAPGLGR